MAATRITKFALSRPALRCCAVSRAALSPLSASSLAAPAGTRTMSAPLASSAERRAYATHTPDTNPAPAGPPAAVGAQLRASIETDLSALASKLAAAPVPASSHVHRYLRPLTPEEVELVNMGQVPPLSGGEVVSLLDLALAPAPFDRETQQGAGPDGKGVHVPLLAMVGSTEPAIPCYPLRELFAELAPRAVRAVHGVLDAQRKNVALAEGTEAAPADVDADERAPLVAIVVPHDGERRDLGLQLAVNLFRLAMQEGNGYQEEIDGSAQ